MFQAYFLGNYIKSLLSLSIQNWLDVEFLANDVLCTPVEALLPPILPTTFAFVARLSILFLFSYLTLRCTILCATRYFQRKACFGWIRSSADFSPRCFYFSYAFSWYVAYSFSILGTIFVPFPATVILKPVSTLLQQIQVHYRSMSLLWSWTKNRQMKTI